MAIIKGAQEAHTDSEAGVEMSVAEKGPGGATSSAEEEDCLIRLLHRVNGSSSTSSLRNKAPLHQTPVPSPMAHLGTRCLELRSQWEGRRCQLIRQHSRKQWRLCRHQLECRR